VRQRTTALVIVAIAFVAASTIGVTSCGGTPNQQAQREASRAAANFHFYVQHNMTEQKNYNLRLQLEDDPATILWCTFSWPGSGGAQQLVTVPIAGKLTSSSKRPTPTADSNGNENADGTGMYGPSVQYRYGFDPTRTIIYEFTDLPSFCTNEPLVWQKNQTNIVSETDATLNSLTRAAEQALRSGDAQKALALLKRADTSGATR